LSEQGRKLAPVIAEVADLKTNAADPGGDEVATEPVPLTTSGPARVILSGRGAVGIFSTGDAGACPNSEFIVDELRLNLEALISDNVYALAELNLATREAQELSAELGEAYIEFEGLSRWWGQERQLSLRAGRLDVPFGEEYLDRDAIDNPLISHSLADFWGIDEGVELFGNLGGLTYVAAVQNGSNATTHDYSGDKSVTLRLGYDPAHWLHLGLSGIRTGDLDAVQEWSELWFGNGFFRSIGSTNTATFAVNAVQGDVRFRLPRGRIHLAGGYAGYDDDAPLSDNHRDIVFYSAEAVHDLARGLYGGIRFSQIFVDGGYPLVGQGRFGQYFFGPLTDELWRLSVGLGYRFNDDLVLKGEYSFERGRQVNGNERADEDMVSGQIAFRF